MRLRKNPTASTSGSTPGLTPTVTQKVPTVVSFAISASDVTKKNTIVFNNSDQVLYLCFGAVASSTNFTVAIQPDGSYETQVYAGAMSGSSAAAPTGFVYVTEVRA